MPHKGYEWPEDKKPERVNKMLDTRAKNKELRDKAEKAREKK